MQNPTVCSGSLYAYSSLLVFCSLPSYTLLYRDKDFLRLYRRRDETQPIEVWKSGIESMRNAIHGASRSHWPREPLKVEGNSVAFVFSTQEAARRDRPKWGW